MGKEKRGRWFGGGRGVVGVGVNGQVN